jgi:hypothetical protein
MLPLLMLCEITKLGSKPLHLEVSTLLYAPQKAMCTEEAMGTHLMIPGIPKHLPNQSRTLTNVLVNNGARYDLGQHK